MFKVPINSSMMHLNIVDIILSCTRNTREVKCRVIELVHYYTIVVTAIVIIKTQ